MKNMALTLMSIMVSLLFARYYLYIPRKLVNGHDGGLKMHKA